MVVVMVVVMGEGGGGGGGDSDVVVVMSSLMQLWPSSRVSRHGALPSDSGTGSCSSQKAGASAPRVGSRLYLAFAIATGVEVSVMFFDFFARPVPPGAAPGASPGTPCRTTIGSSQAGSAWLAL